MPKGFIGTQTNTIINLKKVNKIDCECTICTNFKKNVCYFGRYLFPRQCKWFTAKPGTSLNAYRKKQQKLLLKLNKR